MSEPENISDLLAALSRLQRSLEPYALRFLDAAEQFRVAIAPHRDEIAEAVKALAVQVSDPGSALYRHLGEETEKILRQAEAASQQAEALELLRQDGLASLMLAQPAARRKRQRRDIRREERKRDDLVFAGRKPRLKAFCKYADDNQIPPLDKWKS